MSVGLKSKTRELKIVPFMLKCPKGDIVILINNIEKDNELHLQHTRIQGTRCRLKLQLNRCIYQQNIHL